MEPEERKMLERLLHISEHNNRILRHIRREMLFTRFYRLFLMLLAIGVALVIYYYIKPYIDGVITTIQSAAAQKGF